MLMMNPCVCAAGADWANILCFERYKSDRYLLSDECWQFLSNPASSTVQTRVVHLVTMSTNAR